MDYNIVDSSDAVCRQKCGTKMSRSKYKKRKYIKKAKSLARFFLAAMQRSFKMYTFEYIFNEVQLIGRKRNDDKRLRKVNINSIVFTKHCFNREIKFINDICS